MNRLEIIQKAIKKYGEKHQLLVAVEEMQELSKELLKYVNRGADNEEMIKEEFADCIITLGEVDEIFKFSEESDLEAVLDKKLKRLEKRMNDE